MGQSLRSQHNSARIRARDALYPNGDMRGLILFAVCGSVFAQTPDPAYEALDRAYAALRDKNYDVAIAGFQKAVEAAPERGTIRKDLGYALLRVGENVAAREQFRRAMELDPSDAQVALEYAFLCHETQERQQARRVFDRLRKTGNPTAEQAFQNIDAPLAAGIERWKQAIAMAGGSFSAHFELAGLAEERDELALAAEHYEKAWRVLPERRYVLVHLGRVWKALGREEEASAALLAASRGGEARAAELAREYLPERYPYVAEFRRALEFDPNNAELRRELAYLFLAMGRQNEAEAEFLTITSIAPDDLLSATQLGFLLHARGDPGAQALFDRVLAGNDEDLANRVRAVLRIPQLINRRGPQPASIDARLMAERSIKAGYLKDALKYLQVAHESDPGDFDVMLKLGWTYNNLRLDRDAIRWFELAGRAPDPRISFEAGRAARGLRSSTRRVRTSAWFFPNFSSRYDDVFAYGQVKTELRLRGPLQPYASLRFIGDTRRTTGGVSPQYLSESSAVAAIGVRTPVWRGVMAWAEAGSAISYIRRSMRPDYRGGISVYRGAGSLLGSEAAGLFADTSLDGVFISRFGNDSILYQQGRLGYTFGEGSRQAQIYWNANVTVDRKREVWANFAETGPGLRVSGAAFPEPMYFTFNVLRGAYLAGGRAWYSDFRAGVWYAISH